MATGLKRKKRVAQTAQETEIDSNRSQETASGTPQRRGGRRRRACSCPVALGSRNASDERRNRRWVWRMGKARRDGDGVTGELVLEQGRGIKRSKQHEAAVQCVSPFSSTRILCFGGSDTTPPPAEMLWPAGTERQRAATWCRRFLRAGGLQ